MENIAHLRQLVALAETGNYRKAGERLGISHSAVSQTINKLENQFGVELFERGKSQTIPTIFGSRIVESAKTIIAEIEQAGRDIHLMSNLEDGGLILGVDPNVCESLLAPALGRLMNSHPKLKFKVLTCSWSEVEDKLRKRVVDIYVGLKPEKLSKMILINEICLAPPILVSNSNHPLSKKKLVEITDVNKFPLIGGDVPNWFLTKIVQNYPKIFISIENLKSVFLISQDLSLTRRLLHKTNAIALLPKFTISNDLEKGTLVRIDLKNFPFTSSVPGVVAYLDGYPQSPSSNMLINEINNIVSHKYNKH